MFTAVLSLAPDMNLPDSKCLKSPRAYRLFNGNLDIMEESKIHMIFDTDCHGAGLEDPSYHWI